MSGHLCNNTFFELILALHQETGTQIYRKYANIKLKLLDYIDSRRILRALAYVELLPGKLTGHNVVKMRNQTNGNN